MQHALSRIKDGHGVNGPSPDKIANKGSSVQESDIVISQTSC